MKHSRLKTKYVKTSYKNYSSGRSTVLLEGDCGAGGRSSNLGFGLSVLIYLNLRVRGFSLKMLNFLLINTTEHWLLTSCSFVGLSSRQ